MKYFLKILLFFSQKMFTSYLYIKHIVIRYLISDIWSYLFENTIWFSNIYFCRVHRPIRTLEFYFCLNIGRTLYDKDSTPGFVVIQILSTLILLRRRITQSVFLDFFNPDFVKNSSDSILGSNLLTNKKSYGAWDC